jgi:N utilization substance protein A
MIIDPAVIRQVSREKDIDAEKMFGALEEAMSSAARKYYRDKAMVTLIDRKTGEMTVYSPRTVVSELDTESEEPPPQVLLDEALELVANHGTSGELRVLRHGAEGEPPQEVSDVQLGDEVRIYREAVGLGRIAAQTAKQVLYQKVREAERDNIYNEYFPKGRRRRSSRATSSPAPSGTGRGSGSARSCSTCTRIRRGHSSSCRGPIRAS